MPRGPMNRDHTEDLRRLLLAVWDTHLRAVQKAANTSQGEQGHRSGRRGRDISPPRFSRWDLSEPPRRRLRFSPSLDNLAPQVQHENGVKPQRKDIADEGLAAACTNRVLPPSVPLTTPPAKLSPNSVPSSSSRTSGPESRPSSSFGEAKAPTPVAILLATTPAALEQNGSTPPQDEQGGSGLTAYLITASESEPMDQSPSAIVDSSPPVVVNLCSPSPADEPPTSSPVLPPSNDLITPVAGDLTEPSVNTLCDLPANPGPSHGQEHREEYHQVDLQDLLDLEKPVIPMTKEEWDAVDKMLEEK